LRISRFLAVFSSFWPFWTFPDFRPALRWPQKCTNRALATFARRYAGLKSARIVLARLSPGATLASKVHKSCSYDFRPALRWPQKCTNRALATFARRYAGLKSAKIVLARLSSGATMASKVQESCSYDFRPVLRWPQKWTNRARTTFSRRYAGLKS